MNINLSKLSDKEIAQLCIKHDIIEVSRLRECTRKQVTMCVEQWCKQKQEKYKSRPRAMSDPNIKSIKTVKELSEKVISVFGKGQLDLQYDKNANHEASILHLNCDKSNTKLSWYPTWDFDATIERTVNWYIGHLNGDDPKNLTMLDINEFLKEKK